MKKLLIGLLAAVCLAPMFVWTWGTVSAAWVLQPDNPYKVVDDGGETKDISLIGTWNSTKDWIVNIIKWVINWALGILAFIALIVLLYGWFLMVTAGWESDRYDKWFTILKQAAIWLVFIGIARFVVSIIFRLINLTAEPASTWWAWTDQ